MASLPPLRVIAAALLLAACQAGGGQANGPVTGSAAPIGSAAQNAVSAFGRICGRLDRAEVSQRAARFGFAPLRNEALPEELRDSLGRANGVLYIRPGGPPAILAWTDPAACELWVGGVDLPELEQEFASFLGSVARAAEGSSVAVSRMSTEQVAQIPAANGSRLRQAALIGPRGLVEGSNGMMVLRVSERAGPLQAMLIHRVASSPAQGAEPAATVPNRRKDAPQ